MFPEITADVFADHLRHNLTALRACCAPGVRLCAPLKANAYGHGLEVVAPVFHDAGADVAAVAQLDEGIRLRGCGWTRDILVLSEVVGAYAASDRRARIHAAIDHDLTLTVAETGIAIAIDRIVRAMQAVLPIQIKVDSGMGRMGVVADGAESMIRRTAGLHGLHITGVYSHFGSAELENQTQVDDQLARFAALRARLHRDLPGDVVWHLANTAATILRPDAHFDMVRPGLGLYGYLPKAGLAQYVALHPCLRVSSRITLVKELPAGHCVGYGCTFRTARTSRIGIVPIGYHDGYLRGLSNRGVIGLPSGDAPVIGRVSMDQLAIDLTDLPDAGLGDAAIAIDERRGRPNSAESIASLLGTIPYEVACLIGPRVERRLISTAPAATHAA